jgi:anti-sigma-K factor RskA
MSADIHTLSGAYALNAVTDLEQVAFDRHLGECDTCAQEAAELVATAARLTDSTWSVAPPGLREKVLREVSQTRQVRPGSGRRGAPTGRWRTRLVSAAAAAVLVGAAAATTYAFEENRVGDQRSKVEAGQQQMAAIASVLTAPDAKLYTAAAGTLSVAVSGQKGSAVATMDGMPRPEAGRCYQFWQMRDGTPVSAGLFARDQAAGSLLIRDIQRAQAVAVTKEPCGGSRLPTMNPIAAVTIA